MTVERIAGACIWLVVSAAVAGAQQKSGAGTQAPGTSVVQSTSAGPDEAPARRVQTRSESGNREVVVETSEAPNVDGRLAPSRETVVETARTAPTTAQSRREVYEYGADGRRRLVETTESVRETLANGDISTVHNTWSQDVNGRSGLMARQIERTRSASPDVRQTETTLLVPDTRGTLQETERTEYTERRVDAAVTRHDSRHSVRDVNGRWQPRETRRGEVRASGAERTEEETVQRRDAIGNVVADERVYTRRSTVNGQDREVIEIYALRADQMPRSDNKLVLSERIQRTTTATSGGRQTVEEVEGRSHVAPNEPIRVMRRTVTTVRQTGSGRLVTDREFFERDVNGTMRLVRTESEDATN
jgi:hypothetical protein